MVKRAPEVSSCQLVRVEIELSGSGSTLDKDADLRDAIEDSGDPQIAITRKGQSRSGVPIRGSLVN